MYHIGVIPGDEIGPEALEQAMRVLSAVAEHYSFEYRVERFPFGATHYLETGQFITDDDLEDMRTLDAIVLGPVGDPRIEPEVINKGIMNRIWEDLDLQTNVQRLRLFHEDLCPLKGKRLKDVDMVVVRANRGDFYSDLGGFIKKGSRGEIAFVQGVFLREDVEATIRRAFSIARQRERRHVTLVDRSQFVSAHDIWRRTFKEVALDYPDVSTMTMNADVAMERLLSTPEWFDVLVTTNVIGDLLIPVGLQLVGGVGFAATSYHCREGVAIFMQPHSSFGNRHAMGLGNPVSAILGIAYMLDYLGEDEASASVEAAVARVVGSDKHQNLFRLDTISAVHIGDTILSELSALLSGAAER